jgi:predicted SnoaL-like aldol condensation-catalyzing enzyme
MKQLFSVLTAAAVLISCNDTAKVAGASDNDAAKMNTEHVKEVYRAIETGDVSKMDSFVAPDFIDHDANMDGSDIKGWDSARKMLMQIHTYFDGLKVEFLRDATSADGEYHYAMVRMTGKAKANPWGMPVGEDIDDTSIDLVKIKDGKASEHWGFMSMHDFGEIMKQMQKGMPPPKDSANKK